MARVLTVIRDREIALAEGRDAGSGRRRTASARVRRPRVQEVDDCSRTTSCAEDDDELTEGRRDL